MTQFKVCPYEEVTLLYIGYYLAGDYKEVIL